MLLTACGLKVPLTVVAGAGPAAGNEDSVAIDPKTGAPLDGNTPGEGNIPGSITPTASARPDGVVPGTSLFPKETEGVSNSQITICGHVPITGAAPIPHHPDRFGQFYFNYVNQELGGVFKRKVKFQQYDDQYYPAGARAAVEKCKRIGAFFYVGAAGTDQIVSVAKWAETQKVPYFHGPTSDKDLKGFKYNVHTGPTYEDQHRLLARYLVKRYGKDVPFATIRVNSPYFDAGHDAFKAELTKLGAKMPVDRVVQKDENQFTDIFVEMQDAGIKVVNNFTTPNLWLKMLNQKPASFDPTWTAVSPIAGFNIVSSALKATGSKAVVFHTFAPACNCTDYQTDLDTSAPWYDDEKEFLRIFKKYSPEQKPSPDDFDYSSYLAAKGLHRLLLAVGPNPTRSALFKLIDTYKEDPAKTFPACGADFTKLKGQRKASDKVNVFELQSGKWKQIKTCMNSV